MAQETITAFATGGETPEKATTDHAKDDEQRQSVEGPEVEEGADHQQFDPDAETVTDQWEGRYLYTSWGYDQTNVGIARVVSVSGTGKTVVCRLVSKETVSCGNGSQSVRPTSETYGDEFRLHVRNSGGDPAFRGSYPYVNGDKDDGTRRGWFYPWSRKAGDTIHQTAPGYGH